MGLNGLPNIAFDLIDHPVATELKRSGFAFKLSHQVVLSHGRTARSEWQISSLRTAVYIDGKGTLIWLHPDGRTVKFSKTEPGFTRSTDGSTASVSPDGGMVEIATARSAIWRYKYHFIESLQAAGKKYYFKTERETILAIHDGGSDGNPVLEINYSDTGLLREILFADSRKLSFEWDASCCLRHITGDAGPELAFEYDNRLLKNWRADDGPLHELKWTPADSTFRLFSGQPPVLLGEDSLYTYQWSHGEGADILNVRKKSGAFVSRTRFGTRGIEQETPYEILQYVYKH